MAALQIPPLSTHSALRGLRFVLFSHHSRTDIPSRIGGWRGTALAALFHPPSWRTDRTSFQVVGSPVAASLPLASAHFASPHQVQAVPLSPLALRLAFPALLAGRHSCDYDGDSVPLRLAPGRGSHVPSR